MARQIQHTDNDGATILPASKTLGSILAGATGLTRKFGVKNTGSQVLEDLTAAILQVGLNTGYSHLRIAKDVRTLSPPWAPSAELLGAGAGVWGTTGSKFYVLTSVSASGETVVSTEVSVNVDGLTKTVMLEWTRDPNVRVTAQRLYRSESSGVYSTPALVVELGPTDESYEDIGDTLLAGAPPAENLSDGGAPNYGVVPALGVADLSYGDVGLGQWIFWWAQLVVPAGADDEENPFMSYVEFEEA